MGDTSKKEKEVKTPFFKGVKKEYKKISWPDKHSLVKQSIAVITISITVGLIITLFDTIIQYGVNFLTTWK
ncbi:MAG: preprotein translocase subunit SecE [Eubacteriales bacterium]